MQASAHESLNFYIKGTCIIKAMKNIARQATSFALVLTIVVGATWYPVDAQISGSKCSVVGARKIVGESALRCVFVGKKKLWQSFKKPKSSTTSTAMSTTTTTTTITSTTTTDVYAVPAGYFRPTCGSGVGECPKVDAKRRADECKIADATPGDVSQGFPRPPKAKQGKSLISILVVPVRYGDDPTTEEMVRKQYESEFEKEKEFFKRNSYSRVEVVFTLEPKSQWVQVSETSEVFVSQRGSDLRRVTQDLVQLIPRNDPGKFDGVIFVVAGDGISFGGMDQSATYTHSSGILQTVYLTIGKLRSGLHLDHNLGHTAYYLEDLYLFDRYRTLTSENFPMRYDIMGSGGDFSAWNIWLAGFLLDT